MIKQRIVLFLLVVSFLMMYLEWGGNQQVFVFQVAKDFLVGSKASSDSLSHPLILLPLLGLLLLMYGVVAKSFSRRWMYLGIGLLSTLVFFVLLAGILSLNIKMLMAPLAFIVLAVLAIKTPTPTVGPAK